MITAHLPAGYLTGRCLGATGPVLWAAVLGGMTPDFDLIWFYLIDNRAVHHHHYWIHVPGFWGALGLIILPVIQIVRRHWMPAIIAFFAAVFIHLCLDSVAGGIKWGWPVSDQLWSLIKVPARYENWVLNFVLHPVFLLELAIWAAALFLWWRKDTS